MTFDGVFMQNISSLLHAEHPAHMRISFACHFIHFVVFLPAVLCCHLVEMVSIAVGSWFVSLTFLFVACFLL